MNYSSCCSYNRYGAFARFAEFQFPRTSLSSKYLHYKTTLPTLSAKATEAPPCKDPQADAQLVTGILATRNPSPASMYSILKFPLKYSLKLRYNNAVFFFVEYHNLNFEIRKFRINSKVNSKTVVIILQKN
jgi:hypothetical protein